MKKERGVKEKRGKKKKHRKCWWFERKYLCVRKVKKSGPVNGEKIPSRMTKGGYKGRRGDELPRSKDLKSGLRDQELAKGCHQGKGSKKR